MADSESLITPEAQALVGRSSAPIEGYEVTAHEIRRYCHAIGEQNPLYLDEEAAAQGPHGGIVAPPLFFIVPFSRDVPVDQISPDGIPVVPGELPRPPLRVNRRMAGGVEVEMLRPVRPGDRLVQQRRIAEMREREGRTGRMVFTVYETTYVDQDGETVAVERSTIITR